MPIERNASQLDENLSLLPEGSSDRPNDGEIAALRAELAKWRERVPKLASALRERTEQLDSAEADLVQSREQSSVAGESSVDSAAVESTAMDSTVMESRVKARDELIVELEERVREAGQLHREAASQLHSVQLDLKQTEKDAADWKGKWQAITTSLDESAVESTRSQETVRALRGDLQTSETQIREQSEQHEQAVIQAVDEAVTEAVTKVQREAESLKVRNKNLSETTDFANQQIETLGKEIAQLLQQTEFLDDARRDAEGVRDDAQAKEIALREELDQLLSKNGNEEQRYEQAMQAAEQEQNQLADQLSQQTQLLDDARRDAESARDDAQAKEVALREELDQLLSKIGDEEQRYEQAMQAAEQEQSQLADQLDAKDAALVEFKERSESDSLEREEQLQQKLDRATEALEEQAELVRELEQQCQKAAEESTADSDQAQIDELEQSLLETTRRMETFKDYADGLEDRLEAQKGLMSELEEELSDVQSLRVEDGRKVDSQYQELEALVKETKEQLAVANDQLEILDTDKLELLEQRELGEVEAKRVESELIGERDARTTQQKAVYALQDELESLKKQSLQSDPHIALNEATVRAEESLVKIRELETLLRERTLELDTVRWRVQQAEEQTAPDEAVVLVLNQQLEDLRNENKRLQARLARPGRVDELTRLKGVGEKLAQQLRQLGITAFEQIASLDETQLDDEAHPLHGFKTRIVRDDWIAQARNLLEY